MTTDGKSLHETKVFVLRRRDNDWQGVVSCTCGWKDNTAAGSSSGEAASSAQDRGRAHTRSAGRARATNRLSDVSVTALGLLIGALVLAIPVLLVVGIANVIGGGDEAPPVDPGGQAERDEGSGIDCRDAVTQLMEQEYGSWGAGNWPEGEYPDRVAQCEGR